MTVLVFKLTPSLTGQFCTSTMLDHCWEGKRLHGYQTESDKIKVCNRPRNASYCRLFTLCIKDLRLKADKRWACAHFQGMQRVKLTMCSPWGCLPRTACRQTLRCEHPQWWTPARMLEWWIQLKVEESFISHVKCVCVLRTSYEISLFYKRVRSLTSRHGTMLKLPVTADRTYSLFLKIKCFGKS